MKIPVSIICCLLAAASLFAHDHIEVGTTEDAPGRLALFGPDYQLALLVPVGEPFSGYALGFPGGYYANEMTFTTEIGALEPAVNADPVVEFLSVSGPDGGIFSFWEAGSQSPTWSLPTGWTSASASDPALIRVIVGDDFHIHGRIFTANKSGTYKVAFRAYDENGIFSPSETKTLTFQVYDPPQLQISVGSGSVQLSFASRPNLNYDIQSSTTLQPGSWATILIDEEDYPYSLGGNGTLLEHSDPLNSRPKVFYRLIEFR